MKNKVRNILTICIVLLSILTSSCGEKQFIDKDESAKQEIIKRFTESPVYSLTNDEVIKAFSGSFSERYDEFQKITWFRHINKPKTRYENAIYCYFGKRDFGDDILRVVIQYYTTDPGIDSYAVEDPFFSGLLNKAIFVIDGENITIDFLEIDEEGKCEIEESLFSSKYAEWYDIKVGNSISYDMIKKIANAKTVKVRLIGDFITKDRTLTEKELKTFRDSYYYSLLTSIVS